MSEDLQRIARSISSSYEGASLWGGPIWRSVRRSGPVMDVSSHLRAGLYISCGVANMKSYADGLGGFETSRPVITVLYAPEGGVLLKTSLQSGEAHSFGVHLPEASLEHADPTVHNILQAVRGQPIVAIGGAVARRFQSLSSSIDAWRAGPSRVLMLQSRALELVAETSRLVTDRIDCDLIEPNRRCAYAIRDLIDADVSASIRLDDLARRMNISVRSMTNAFRSAFNESIVGYLTRRRMEEAAKLIADGKSVSEAAYLVGYKPSSFSTAFRRHFGYAPKQGAK